MRITILTIGSRGDIQPFVALGKGLQAAGHQVKLCTDPSFKPFVTQHGLEYANMNGDLLKLKDTNEGKQALEGKRNNLNLMKQAMPLLRAMLDDCWQAAQDAELLIYHPKTLAGSHLAEKLKVPTILSMPLPLFTPTAAFPSPIFPPLKLGAAYNRLSYKLVGLVSAPFAGMINGWRKDVLGLPPRSMFASETRHADGSPMQVLYSYSEQVVPRPADWPEWVNATGYWFLEEQSGWQPSRELLSFLEAGAPPVYIGFGSMTGTNAEGRARIVIEALQKAGQRGIIATGWGGLQTSNLPKDVFVIDQAPHDWLFPRMAAIVHHGGAGTTAAGLRAGKPSIVIPFIADQPFWGRQVHAIGAGPQPIPLKQLSAERLNQAICEALTTESIQRNAAEIGRKLRVEDGVQRAVEHIGVYAERKHSPVKSDR